MSMKDTFNNQEDYNFSQQSAADEPYFHAGTHHLPQTPSGIPSTRQIEQDIDDGLQQFHTDITIVDFNQNNANFSQALDDALDLSNIELPIDFSNQPWMSDTANSTYTSMLPTGSSLLTTDNQDAFVPTPARRTDSGLRATAKPFVPANQQWQGQQMVQWTSQNLQQIQGSIASSSNTARQSATHNIPQRSRDWTSHMTPLQTNLASIYQTPPMSAPSRPDMYAQRLATSPMISLTNDMAITTAIPSQQEAGHGYQWGFTTPPALDINTWAEGTRHFMDPARLTPVTPVTPVNGASSLERTLSRTSRTSRTTSGPYKCPHCDKECKSKTDFSHHKRNHGERHHACVYCEKKFVFRKDLGRHEKTHTGARQMFGDIVEGCQWCAKGFQRKDHYERHMSTHQKKGDVLTPAASSADAMSRSQSRQ